MIELGVLFLERLEFVHELVEFGVGDLGIVEHVVAVLVVADLLAQGFDLLVEGGRHAGKIIVGNSPVSHRSPGKENWLLTIGYRLFAFLIRPLPPALRPTLEGGFRESSSNSFSTVALLRSSLREA